MSQAVPEPQLDNQSAKEAMMFKKLVFWWTRKSWRSLFYTPGMIFLFFALGMLAHHFVSDEKIMGWLANGSLLVMIGMMLWIEFYGIFKNPNYRELPEYNT